MKKELDNINVKLFLFRFWFLIIYCFRSILKQNRTSHSRSTEEGVANTWNYN